MTDEPRNVHTKAYVRGSQGFIPDVDGVVEAAHLNGAARIQRAFKFSYDFAVDGGAVAVHVLRGASPLPSGFIINHAVIDIRTLAVSAADAGRGAISSSKGAGDLLSAQTTDQFSVQTTDLSAGVIKLTAEGTPILTITVAAWTAGKFDLYVSGFDSGAV